MRKLVSVCTALTCLAVAPHLHAQSAKLQRIGVVGDVSTFRDAVDGLRSGLKESGLAEDKHFVLHLRDTKGEYAGIEQAVNQLVSERVDILFAMTTAVVLSANKSTRDVPIVFYVGDDPVRTGLVQSFAKPGGRMTGIYNQRVQLMPKRMEIVRQLLPGARRVISFYDPTTTTTRYSVKLAREAASKLGMELIERPVASADELVAGVTALRPGEVDAFFLVGDQTVTRATGRILPLAAQRKLPVIVQNMQLVNAGALAAYGANYFDIGRMAAKYMKLIIGGTRAGDIPVETYDKVQLALNLRVAKELGLTIPQPVILRADQVIR